MTGPSADPALIELYKLGADLADRISARRGTANGFFLTAETTLVAVVGFALRKDTAPGTPVRLAICAAGALLCLAWWLQLRSFRQLNRAKYVVLTDIEQRLPVQLFGPEQAELDRGDGRLRGLYAELGATERAVPVLFALVWLALAVWAGR